MDQSEYLLGHEPVIHRINVRRELDRIKVDPLGELLSKLDADKVKVLSGDFSRYRTAYWFYYLSYARYLPEMSIAARHEKMIPRGKYTETQRKLARSYLTIAPYLEFDFTNLLLHSRILLDRTIALSRSFLTGRKLPSFTSFNDHRKFFQKLKEPFGPHSAYAEYLRKNTDWFEMPLKFVRDKFIVHASPQHMRFLGYPMAEWALDLNIILPDGTPEAPFQKVKVVRVNALRLSLDIQGFLAWFAAYGMQILAGAHNRSLQLSPKRPPGTVDAAWQFHSVLG